MKDIVEVCEEECKHKKLLQVCARVAKGLPVSEIDRELTTTVLGPLQQRAEKAEAVIQGTIDWMGSLRFTSSSTTVLTFDMVADKIRELSDENGVEIE